jgi:hypothetical protein
MRLSTVDPEQQDASLRQPHLSSQWFNEADEAVGGV